MKLIVKLYSLTEKAKDKSTIPIAPTRDYLNSSAYTVEVLEGKGSFFGITHKDRKPGDKKYIGPDDMVLVNRNTIGFVSRIWIDEDTSWVMAEITMFDEEKFSGEVYDSIMYVKGLVREGVKIKVSAVIDAFWSATEVALKIMIIDGVDITRNPSFEGAGLVSWSEA
jgi:hypothetical protein